MLQSQFAATLTRNAAIKRCVLNVRSVYLFY
ncbi:hypothetical protein VPHD480_0436 [Vibrio phage D480]